MGNVPPHGAITFKRESIAGLRPHEIAHCGIDYVPADRAIFPTLTVEQNLLLGVRAGRRSTRWSLEDTHRLFPVLAEHAHTPAGVLSVGEQQRGGWPIDTRQLHSEQNCRRVGRAVVTRSSV